MADASDLDYTKQIADRILRQCLRSRLTIADQEIIKVAPTSIVDNIRALARPTKEPINVDRVLEDAETIFDYRVRMDHPRFFGFIPSPASDVSWLGEVLNTSYNTHAGSWYQSSGPSAVESTLVSWFAEVLGLPSTAGGCFVSGGSMANLTAMMAARDRKLSFEDRPNACIYLSSQTHSSIKKGLAILGFHNKQVRTIACTSGRCMNVQELERAVELDRLEGKIPFLLVANCGTTNTGSIDPLDAIRSIADRYGMWLHADGAYGATMALSNRHKQLIDGLHLCDSLSWDAHKWLFQTYSCGLVLVRDKSWLTETFATSAEYIQDAAEGGNEFPNFWNYGMELTRPARAMKLWFYLRVVGLDAVGNMIDHGIRLAEVAEEALGLLPDWSVVSPAQLGIVCFRFMPADIPPGDLDALNQMISRKAIETNLAAPLTTRLDGSVVLRMCSIHPELLPKQMVDIVHGLDQVAQSLLLAEF